MTNPGGEETRLIIEWHTHVYPPEEAADSPFWGGRCPMTVENVLAAHQRNNIDITVFSNAAHYMRGKAEKDELVRFRENFNIALDEDLVAKTQFPSRREVFVFVIQYFAAENEYARRDIDNMAKTILDILKGRFYYDDSQVKTLLVGKKRTDHRVDQNFAYIAIKELNDDRDVDALKISGVERAVTAFQESQAKLK